MRFVRSVSGTWHIAAGSHGERFVTECNRLVKPSRFSNEATDIKWIKPASSVCTECHWPQEVRDFWQTGCATRQCLTDQRRDELIAEGVDPDVAKRAAYYERQLARGFSGEDAMKLALENTW